MTKYTKKPSIEPSPNNYRGITSWAINRPVSTISITSVIIVLGIIFSGRLPVDLLPQIDYPHIRVVVNYPGVIPEVIEEQVTRPLERNLAATENLRELHGRASEGRSYIEMYFDYDVDIDIALQDATRQLERARTELPDGIDPPRIMKMDPSLNPIYELAITSPVRSTIEIRDWVDQRLLPQLLSVPGVGSIDAAGGKIREIDVVADPDRLRSYGLTLADISASIAGQNIDRTAGNITSYEYDIMARTETRYRSASDVANTIVQLPGSGRTIMLSDIATVTDGHREQRLFAYLNGGEAVQVSVMKQPQANTVAVINGIEQRLQNLRESGFITPDLEIETVRNESFFITASIRSVTYAIIIGGLLAIIVLLCFLGSIKRSLIIAFTLPVAIIAAFILMMISGLTLNIMSLGGLALGIGLLIDNSIVMLENIFRHQDDLGKTPKIAAHEGSHEVLSAVVAGTVTNLAAVLPFLLITGIAALIFRELILTIAFAIAASLVAAITLIPMLSSLVPSRIKISSGFINSPVAKLFNRSFNTLRGAYRSILYILVIRKWIFISGAAILLVISILILSGFGSEFLPPVDDGRITMRFVLPAGTSIEPTNEAAFMIEDEINKMPHVESVYMTVGGYFRGGQLSIRGGMIDGTVQLKSPSKRRGYSAERWVTEFRERVSGLGLPFVQERIRGPRIEGLQTSLTEADIAIGIVGEDLDVLEDNARSMLQQLQTLPGIGSIQIGRDARIPQLIVRVDKERSAQFQLTSDRVAGLLHDAVEGIVPTRYVEGGFEYNIRVRYARDVTGTIAGLQEIPVSNIQNKTMPLGSLVSFEEITGPAHIERVNQIRVVWVNTTVNMNQATVGEVGALIRTTLQNYELPDGYSLLYGGEQEAIEESNRSLMLAIGLAIFFVFVVMAVLYEKIFSPLVIMTSLPFTLIGVAFAMLVTGLPFSAPVLLGIIFLTGIVVNNAILLVEFIETHRLQGEQNIIDAVIEAGTVRFRPILMTTLTSIAGMLPLAVGLGEGSELLQPLAITVIGGLIVGTFLTLIILPGMYVAISEIRDGFKKRLE